MATPLPPTVAPPPSSPPPPEHVSPPAAPPGSSRPQPPFMEYGGVEIKTRVGVKTASLEGQDRILAMRAERHREAATMDPNDFDSLYSWALVLQVRARITRHASHAHAHARPTLTVLQLVTSLYFLRVNVTPRRAGA